MSSPSSLMTSVAREFRSAQRTTKRAADLEQQVGAVRAVDDPVEYATKVLGITPWSKQAEIMRAVAAHKRVAVRSGHKIGKSALAAAVAHLHRMSAEGTMMLAMVTAAATQPKE